MALSSCTEGDKTVDDTTGKPEIRRAADQPQPIDIILDVIKHPRCMNCHTVSEWPRQGDDRHRHLFNVVRGPDDHGVSGLMCSACHHETNNDIAGVPGAPHWGLAPLSMGWEYMTDGQICEQLLDPERNGGRSLEDTVKHMTSDALVQWAWEPGLHPGGKPRTVPEHDQATFHEAVRKWAEGGGQCPDPNDGEKFDPERARTYPRKDDKDVED